MATILSLDDFACSICLDTLHKPSVNHCGHAFCFWCFHQSMGGVGASHCPLCRAEFKHFAAICKPLHLYLQARFPAAAAERDEQTKKQEREELNAESPDISETATADPLEGFRCCGCQQLAVPPAVLRCGHVVCARPGGWASCPVDGCVGTAPIELSSLAICGVIDSILRAEHAEYEVARARGCTALVAMPAASSSEGLAAAVSEENPEANIGKAVEVHSLTSEAGKLLNGQRGIVEEYEAITKRFVVIFSERDAPRRRSIKAANLCRIPYVHFGRGCDGCGVYPIEGTCMKCKDCSEAIGYDLCGRCYEMGVHKRQDPSGRFNQAHRPEHLMEEVPQEDTVLHQLQRAHPEISVEQILALVTSAQEGGHE